MCSGIAGIAEVGSNLHLDLDWAVLDLDWAMLSPSEDEAAMQQGI